jgi:hypothetical protein
MQTDKINAHSSFEMLLYTKWQEAHQGPGEAITYIVKAEKQK